MENLADYSDFTVETDDGEEYNGCAARKIAAGTWHLIDGTADYDLLFPDVEDYNGFAARKIAAGTGLVIKLIRWFEDVATDGLMWGGEIMQENLKEAEEERKVDPKVLKSLQRVRKVTKKVDEKANKVLIRVKKFSAFFSISNAVLKSKVFGFLPREMIIATVKGCSKVVDAGELCTKQLLKTSLNVTTEVVDHKYGAKTAQATNDGLGAGGHAFGTAWAIIKMKKAVYDNLILESLIDS